MSNAFMAGSALVVAAFLVPMLPGSIDGRDAGRAAVTIDAGAPNPVSR